MLIPWIYPENPMPASTHPVTVGVEADAGRSTLPARQTGVPEVPAGKPVVPPLRQGKILTRTLSGDPRQTYYLYVPHGGGAGRPVFVTVHGISRNAREHARRFVPFAERYRVVLVAPLFPADRFSRYQRLEQGGNGGRPDLVLQRIVAEAGSLTEARTNKIYLFGFSGGGQFVHRYVMRYPARVARFVVGSAGWYTFPLSHKRYPLGIKPRHSQPGLSFDPTEFLGVPGGVVVGKRDRRQDSALNKSRRIDEEQGGNRVERAREWVKAMNVSAHKHGLDTDYFFQIMPHCGHSFSGCMKRGNMGERVFAHLFPSADKGAGTR